MAPTTTHDGPVPKKWEGKATAKLEKAKPDQVFGYFKDFVGMDTWYPGITSCKLVGGVNGQPGCTRHVIMPLLGSDGSGEPFSWTHERILTVDDEARVLTYTVLENNIGFEVGSYLSTVRIVPDGEGCVIEWGFTVAPVEGWTLDRIVSVVYEPMLEVMAKRMEEAASVAFE